MADVLPPRPLARDDDRSAFDCGREAMNLWFERHAWKNQVNDASRVSVICSANDGAIVGYVTLSASEIERAFLPKAQQRNRPDPIPVVLLGQLAVHKDYQGKGYAASLLRFAVKTAVKASDSIGIVGVITHPLDDSLRAFYAKWNFKDLPFDPKRAMMVRVLELRNSGL